MADILVQSPTLGIDTQLPVNLIDDRAAAVGTQNVDYQDGVICIPSGFTEMSGLLVSGEEVLGICNYKEVNNNRINVVAATNTKILRHDIVNDKWDELFGATLNANRFFPVSFASIPHQDSVGGRYQHLIISDGGRGDIVRWGGDGDTLAKLAGAGGYNIGTTAHRALQVCAYQNRLILISPYEYTGMVWQPNHSRVRWPQVAQLEVWDGVGAGAADLIDTGDVNIRAELTGNLLTIYQSHSIWQLRYVGGTDVFTPDILIPDIGLLSFFLCTAIEGRNFFVANDYNIYTYSGGTMIENIGLAIRKNLLDSIDKSNLDGCRMAIDAGRRHLWIFIPTAGNTWSTRAYKYNLSTGSWTVRDFSHHYQTGGITAATLLAAGVYRIGDTYADAKASGQTYAQAKVQGKKYNETFEEARVEEKLTIGDHDGYVLYEDSTVTTDGGDVPIRYHYTKEFDGGMPDVSKRIDGVEIDAKGTNITIERKIDNGAWTAVATINLVSEFKTYRRFINRTGKKIQLRFSGDFNQIRSFGIFNAQPEDRR